MTSETLLQELRELRSEDGENSEYDRALVEVWMRTAGADRSAAAEAVLDDPEGGR